MSTTLRELLARGLRVVRVRRHESSPRVDRLMDSLRAPASPRELAREDDRIWLGAGDAARLGIWKPGEKEFGDEGGAHVHFAFAVEPRRLAGLAERLAACGVDVDGPHEHDGGDRSMYVRDPEGNVVEVWDYFPRGRTVDGLDDGQAG